MISWNANLQTFGSQRYMVGHRWSRAFRLETFHFLSLSLAIAFKAVTFKLTRNSHWLNYNYNIELTFNPFMVLASSVWQTNVTIRQLHFKQPANSPVEYKECCAFTLWILTDHYKANIYFFSMLKQKWNIQVNRLIEPGRSSAMYITQVPLGITTVLDDSAHHNLMK